MRKSRRKLAAEGDDLDRKNRNFEAVALYLQADSQKPRDAGILWRISKQYAQLMMDAESASSEGDSARRRSMPRGERSPQIRRILKPIYPWQSHTVESR